MKRTIGTRTVLAAALAGCKSHHALVEPSALRGEQH